MTPTEFALWLNGALGVMGDDPTPEQMTKIREKLGEAIGKITADRLLERAEEQLRKDTEKARASEMLRDLQKQQAALMASKHDEMLMKMAGYKVSMDDYRNQVFAVGNTLPAEPGAIMEVPLPPPQPGILSTLLGKKKA